MRATIVNVRRRAVAITVIMLLLSPWCGTVFGSTVENLNVDLSRVTLVVNTASGSASISLGFGNKYFGNDWEIKKIGSQQFHLRRKPWENFFWSVDFGKSPAEFLRVVGGTFGLPGAKGAPVTQAKIQKYYFNTKPEEQYLEFTFSPASFSYGLKEGVLQFVKDGAELIEGKELEITCSPAGRENLCQIRHRLWSDHHLEVQLKEGKVFWAEKSEQGLWVKNQITSAKVDAQFPHVLTGMFEDRGFIENHEERRPQSPWIESRKMRYRDLLKRGKYDVLLVPFQVHGYAIDRTGRSLMTRYLADRIARTTTLKVPDPTLVARALGEDARTFDENEVYRLANELKVKVVVAGAVGHNRDEKLKLTMLVQKPDEKGFFSATKATRLDWQEIPFSDEHLPEAAFKDMLDEVMAKLPLQASAQPKESVKIKESRISVPPNIERLISDKPASPVIAAYDLQFLAMLFPADTTAMEHLFERSLIILDQVSPKSADYRLLKARALFHLHRRPAALAALGTPTTPEEKGFAAYLNGNLPTLKRLVAEMTSPLPKLIAQIEMIDLRWTYKERVTIDDYRRIVDGLPDWEMLLVRRLQKADPWFSQSNLVVKEQMDRLFPVKNYTAEDLLRSKMTMANVQLDDADIALSVHEHYRRYLDNNMDIQQVYGNQYPSRSDALDLFHDIGWANLLQDLQVDAENRGLPSEALERLGKYEKVYRGHPALTYVKGSALAQQWNGKKELEYLLAERDELRYQTYYWSGGQVRFKFAADFPVYDADYPHRPFWGGGKGGDRAAMKSDKLYDTFASAWRDRGFPGEKEASLNYLKDNLVALKYTNDNFYPIEYGYSLLIEHLKRLGMVDNYLELGRDRFEGSPGRLKFDLKLADDAGDPVRKIKALEDAIAAVPDVWSFYQKLGDVYIKSGNLKKAQEVFFKYPLFTQGEEGDRVKMSNDALRAAADIWWRGGVEESIPLFRIAAASRTGSGAEMASAGYQALIDQDYLGASAQFLRMIKRYESPQGYREYLTLLHAGGFHQEAWSIFNTIDIRSSSPGIWTPAFIGHRMERATDEQIAEWLTQDHFHGVDQGYLARYLLGSLLIDRMPDRKSPDLIKTMINNLKPTKDEYAAAVRLNLPAFAEGFYHLRTNEFELAYQLLDKWVAGQGRFGADFAMPYLAFCEIKSNKLSKLNELLQSLDKTYANGSAEESRAYLYLAKAYQAGLQGDHPKAMEELRRARFSLPFTESRPFSPWYQLVEACEWLYRETGFSGYRVLAVEWAKIHQRIQPYFAWAYAVEAKYSESETDRLKALAIAIYLDPNSERIFDLSQEEKAKARKWLEQHKPFLLGEARPAPRIRSAALGGHWISG